MKAARMIVMLGALAAAGGAGFIALQLASREPETIIVERDSGGTVAPPLETEEVLVAGLDIPVGTQMKPDRLRWQTWPKDALSEGYMVRSADAEAMEKLDGAIARSQFFAGEPIRENKLVRSDRGYMSAILPAGQRAVATTISTETSAGGFILPNDRVDVIMTRRQRETESGTERFVTESILENVRVLAIDQTIEEKNGESVVVGQTATLQLTPAQSQVLIVAQQMADRLTLALRSIEDSKSTDTRAAYHLIGGKGGNGKIKLIRYGSSKELIIPTESKE